MTNSHTEIFVHFVWATWDREPLIRPEWEAELYACLAAKCQELNANLYEIGGTENHVHILLRLAATISVADLAKHLKGSSSHLMNSLHRSSPQFRWQGAYYARGVERENLAVVRECIRRQKEHHSVNNLDHNLELID